MPGENLPVVMTSRSAVYKTKVCIFLCPGESLEEVLNKRLDCKGGWYLKDLMFISFEMQMNIPSFFTWLQRKPPITEILLNTEQTGILRVYSFILLTNPIIQFRILAMGENRYKFLYQR